MKSQYEMSPQELAVVEYYHTLQDRLEDIFEAQARLEALVLDLKWLDQQLPNKHSDTNFRFSVCTSGFNAYQALETIQTLLDVLKQEIESDLEK